MGYFGCWEWDKSLKSSGYGQVTVAQHKWVVHRLAYTLLVGPIPDGHELHHICENRLCYNPDHLRVVTAAAHPGNGPDINRRKTHCPDGHAYTPANTYISPNGGRICRACKQRREKEWNRKNKARNRAILGVCVSPGPSTI